MKNEINYWVKQLGLLPHPEGGFYKRTYCADTLIPKTALPSHDGDRPYGTAIYFLITATNFSAFHRLKTDEVWHFYTGSPICIHGINPQGKLKTWYLGNPLNTDALTGDIEGNNEAQCQFQVVVPAGYWFAATVVNEQPNAYALVGCTLAPGFEFADFELANPRKLSETFPQHEILIEQFTRV